MISTDNIQNLVKETQMDYRREVAGGNMKRGERGNCSWYVK